MVATGATLGITHHGTTHRTIIQDTGDGDITIIITIRHTIGTDRIIMATQLMVVEAALQTTIIMDMPHLTVGLKLLRLQQGAQAVQVV